MFFEYIINQVTDLYMI